MAETAPYPAQEIDPRLQEPVAPDTQAFSSTLPPSLQQQQYTAPPSWPAAGYNPYYGHPDQQPSQAGQPQHAAPYPYQQYQHPPNPAIQPEVNESKRSRACEICRGLKVRCEPHPNGGQCKRCAKAGRNCVISPPSRKRQKKTDSRVAELERKIDALTQSLKLTKENISEDGNVEEQDDTTTMDVMSSTSYHHEDNNRNAHANNRKRPYAEVLHGGPSDSSAGVPITSNRDSPLGIPNTADPNPSAYQPLHPVPKVSPNQDPGASASDRNRTSNLTGNRDADVVSRGLISAIKADNLFTLYTNHMSQHMPVVAFPASTTADAVRKTSPVLFLAILSVASIQDDSDLRAQLTKEVMRILGERIFASPERSLELVQSLQVVTIWYWPEVMSDSKYLQFVHFATAMAMALGINEEAEAKRPPAFDVAPSLSIPNTAATECRRAWLGCYLLSSR